MVSHSSSVVIRSSSVVVVAFVLSSADLILSFTVSLIYSCKEFFNIGLNFSMTA